MINTIYHYTKFQNLGSIITQDGIELYATHYSKYNKHDYKFTRGYSEPVIRKVCQFNNIDYDEDLTFEPYIISFSESPKSNIMWNERFGDNGKGIRLGFDVEQMKNYAYTPPSLDVFLPCFYGTDQNEIAKWLIKTRDELFDARSLDFQDDLMLISSCLVPNRFDTQREWRYVIPCPTIDKIVYDGVNFIEHKVKVKNADKLVQGFYNKVVLKSIILGPNANPNLIDVILNHLDRMGGYKHVRVLQSKFRYREL